MLRLYRGNCYLFLSYFLLFNQFIVSAISNANDAIKTSIPKDTLSRSQSFQFNQEDQIPSSLPSGNNKNLNTLITLDLAGNFDVHVSSPSVIVDGKEYSDDNGMGDDYNTMPLFRWGKIIPNTSSLRLPKKINNLLMNSSTSGHYIPHVHVGGQYDFRKVWYGLTRIRSTLSWGKINKHAMESDSSNNFESLQQCVSADVSLEKSLDNENDYALDFGLNFPIKTKTLISPKKKQYASLLLRYETMNHNHNDQPTTSIYAKTNFLHPQLHLVGKSVAKLEQNLRDSITKPLPSLSTSPFLSRIRQQKISLQDESSWIPNVKVTPGGKVISNSSFGFGHSNLHRIGFRMTIKKQINWNVLGAIFQHGGAGMDSLPKSYDANDESFNDTSVRLEVCGLTGANSLTSLSFQAALERIKETFQCTLCQEGVLS